MASFLRGNQPWAQLTERGNITIRELDVGATGSSSASSSAKAVRLTPSFSFVPVPVPHRAELSDTVAYVVTLSSDETPGGEKQAMSMMYCPDTDGWSGWKRSIRSWCEEVDVALLDATFYSKGELKGRDMNEVMCSQRCQILESVLTVSFACSSTPKLPRAGLYSHSDVDTASTQVHTARLNEKLFSCLFA